MKPVHPTADAPLIRIGAKLRASRQAQSLTLEQLAAATGLTKGFISRIERDDTTPSVPTLVQLCQALSLPIGTLFEEPELQLIRRSDAPHINMGGVGADERLVTPRAEGRVQMLRSALAPHAHGGEDLYTVNCNLEALHVIAGSLEVFFTHKKFSLEVDDTLTFPGQTPHNWRAGAEGAEVVWILVPAAWSGSA